MTFEEYTACDAHDLRALLAAGEIEAAAGDSLTRADALVNGLAGPLFESPLASDADGPLPGGSPDGTQLVARPGREDLLIRVASQFVQAGAELWHPPLPREANVSSTGF